MTRQTNQAIPTGAATDFKGGEVNKQELEQIRQRCRNACDYPGPVTLEESWRDIPALLEALEGRE